MAKKQQKKSIEDLKTYGGSAGTYYVIADDGDNEFALNVCTAQKSAEVMVGKTQQTIPTLGLGIRLRYYANDGDASKFQKGFPQGKYKGGSDGTVRIKEYVPVVHAAAGLTALRNAIEEDGPGEDIAQALINKIEACGGTMVVDFDALMVILAQPLNGVPDSVPQFDVPFDAIGTKGQSEQLPLDKNKVPPAPLAGGQFNDSDD